MAPGWQATRLLLQLLGIAALTAVCLSVAAFLPRLPGFLSWWRYGHVPDSTNFTREHLFPDAPDLSPQWPARLLGGSVRGPFVHSFSLQVAESCRGLPAWGSSAAAMLFGGPPISVQEASLALAEAARFFNASTGMSIPAPAPEGGEAARVLNESTGLSIPDAAAEGSEERSSLRALLLRFSGGVGNGFMSVALGATYAFLSARRLVLYPVGRSIHVRDSLLLPLSIAPPEPGWAKFRALSLCNDTRTLATQGCRNLRSKGGHLLSSC